MATSIYINTDLKDLTANAVANINRPTQVVRLPQMVEGEVVDVVLHLVKSNGAYDARSGTAVDVAVAISAKGKAATSGTFKLNAGIESTGDLSWNASAEAVEGALNALNGGSGAYGSKVSVQKLANGSYRVIFDDVGARVDMAGQSLDLAPESTVGVSTSVVGSPAIRAQQVIEISQQPAIFSETWASAGSTWTGQLDANTARVQELIAEGADAFFEIKVGTDVVCQVPISILPSVAAPNSFPAHTLPDNLDAFAANPTTNGFFSPANWRDDLNLVVGEDVQAWSTNLDEVAAKMSWNNQDLTFDIATGSDGVVIQVGQEVVLLCRNKSGEVLVDGDVVKIIGATGGTPNITKAIASTVDEAHKTIGVCTQTIPNNSTGFITELGKVRGLSFPNTAFDEGDLLYLSDTIPGAFTKIKPPIEVELGQVIRTGNNNGEFAVSINNEASLYELEQELLTLIAANATDIAAKVPNDSTTGTPSATTFLRGDNAWASLAGGGDMLKSVYDPSNKDASAFSMGNMDETTTAKILTDTERSEIAANTSKVGITPTQASDITTNNAKVGITPTQASDITTNNAKVGITPTQAADIVTNNDKVTNATHTGDVTGGTVLTIEVDAVDIPMLSATGTPDGTTFLRGDNTWAAAGAAWGGITGTLSTQTDLQSALDAKEVRTDANGAFSAGDLGGNARGLAAINIQAARSLATEVASGDNAIAIGNNSIASAELSSAFGNKAKATGTYSTASGYHSTASNAYSTASGYYSEASAFASIAIGGRTTASGGGSTASGYNATASGSSATAVGKGATASGTRSTALGEDATASGIRSTAVGNKANASGTRSTAVGFQITNATDNSPEIGYWSGVSVRAGGIKVFDTGMVCQSVEKTDTAYINALPSNPTISGNLTRTANQFDGTVTVNTTAAHELVTGHKVTISGCTPSTFDSVATSITKVDANTFTYLTPIKTAESTTISGTISVAGAGSEPSGTIFPKGMAFRVTTTGNLIVTYCDAAGTITSRDLGLMA